MPPSCVTAASLKQVTGVTPSNPDFSCTEGCPGSKCPIVNAVKPETFTVQPFSSDSILPFLHPAELNRRLQYFLSAANQLRYILYLEMKLVYHLKPLESSEVCLSRYYVLVPFRSLKAVCSIIAENHGVN